MKESKLGFEEDPTLGICKREAKIIFIFWVIQATVMCGVFYFLGYHKNTDPLGWPLGLPSFYLLGGIIPAIVSIPALMWIVKKYFTDLPLE